MNRQRSAVALLQMGAPEDLESIRPFLHNLFSDPSIMPLPGPPPLRRALAGLIASLRARKVEERYRAIGGGSPLVRITRGQAEALEAWLSANGIPAPVRAVFRYCPPRADGVVGELKKKGITRLVALSLYPHFSVTTTGSSLGELKEAVDREGGMDLEVIDRWSDHPSYIELLSRWIRGEEEGLREAAGGETAVLFSAHGLPEKVIERGDPYFDEVRRTAAAVGERLPGIRFLLGFQSRLGPMRWIGPPTGALITRLAREGVRGVLLVPISFVSDHIETLYDLDIVYRNRAREAGIPHYRRLRAFNDDPGFIDVLGSLVRATAGGAFP